MRRFDTEITIKLRLSTDTDTDPKAAVAEVQRKLLDALNWTTWAEARRSSFEFKADNIVDQPTPTLVEIYDPKEPEDLSAATLKKFIDDNNVELFAASLKFPRLASYVVNKLTQRYGISREKAAAIWDAHLVKQPKAAK